MKPLKKSTADTTTAAVAKINESDKKKNHLLFQGSKRALVVAFSCKRTPLQLPVWPTNIVHDTDLETKPRRPYNTHVDHLFTVRSAWRDKRNIYPPCVLCISRINVDCAVCRRVGINFDAKSPVKR